MDITSLPPWRQSVNRRLIVLTKGVNRLDAVLTWCVPHWLGVVSTILGLVLTGAVLVPVFYALGWVDLGTHLFVTYHLICAQIPSHSYFLFGYQLALCARNLAIYGSLFLGTLLFRFVRAWLPPLDWRGWLVTMVPMALDGGTQLFGWRESNWELRTLTGAIFGLGVCWFLLPTIQDVARNAPGVPARAPLPWRRNTPATLTR